LGNTNGEEDNFIPLDVHTSQYC